MPSYEAIVTAVKDRLRPILMTALTTILGLVPLALGLGEGTEINQPMGIAVIGGLVSSTLLTLFIIPVVYSLLDKETRRMNKMYATPDGHLVPGYLLKGKKRYLPGELRELGKEDDSTKTAPTHDPHNSGLTEQEYSRDEMARMLEELLKMVKDEDGDKRGDQKRKI
jgi:HAE1 family hydrophobic/amphiphilic exporter-1